MGRRPVDASTVCGEVEQLFVRVAALEAGRTLCQPPALPVTHAELIAALRPFADLVAPEAGQLPDDAMVTRGSPLVRKALTAGQCRLAGELLNRLQAEVPREPE